VNTAVIIGEAGKCICGEEMAEEGNMLMVMLDANGNGDEPRLSGEGRFKIGLRECVLNVDRLGESIRVRHAD